MELDVLYYIVLVRIFFLLFFHFFLFIIMARLLKISSLEFVLFILDLKVSAFEKQLGAAAILKTKWLLYDFKIWPTLSPDCFL